MTLDRRNFALALSAVVAIGCSDPTGPALTEENVFVHVDAATVPLVVADAFHSLWLTVPLTVTNNSSRTVYMDGYCFATWHRLEAGQWIEVFSFDCEHAEIYPVAVFPGGSQQVSIGRGVSGPNYPVLDFALPGTYRLHVALFLDSRLKKSAAETLGFSNAFTVVLP